MNTIQAGQVRAWIAHPRILFTITSVQDNNCNIKYKNMGKGLPITFKAPYLLEQSFLIVDLEQELDKL